VLDVRTAAARAAALQGPVAFVFGNEQAGLTNDEMLACQTLVHIPANPGFTSLNLAQAVQVVAYELFMVSAASDFQMRSEKRATVADREGLYEHLERAAVESEFFDPASGSKLPTRLRRLFSRVPDLEREEVNILRGLLNALQDPKSK
jgi:tRNA/rRNA methyltransferase